MKMENISLLILVLFSVLCSCGSNRIKRLENRVGRLEESAAYHEDLTDIDKKISELNASLAECFPSERVAAMIPDKAVNDESLSHLTRMKVALADEKALWRREAAVMETAIADNRQGIEQVKNELQAKTQTLETTLNGVKDDITTYVDLSTNEAKVEVQNHVQKTVQELRAETQTLEISLNDVKDDIKTYVDISTTDVQVKVQSSVVQKIIEMKTYVDSSFQTKARWRQEAAAMETAIADNKQDIEQAKSEVQNHVQKTVKELRAEAQTLATTLNNVKEELRAEAQTLETTLNSVKVDITAYVDLSTKDVKNDVQSSVVQKNDELKTYIDSSIKEIRDLIVDKLTAMENNIFFQSCLGYYNNGERLSGVYTIYPHLPSKRQPVQVYCDMTTDGGGWTVFQRRQDGTVDFYRTWHEYASGFGNVNGEFWLGNDIISSLTSNGPHELRVDLENYDGETAYAKINNFRVSTSQDNYRLQVSGFSGDAGDSLAFHNGMAFSTRDQDNDIWSWSNCAQDYSGAWWYKNCHSSNLNGLYGQGHGLSGVTWRSWKSYSDPMKKTTMMLRARPHT